MKKNILPLTMLASAVLLASPFTMAGNHWARNTVSFKLQVIDSVTSVWQTQLQAAMQEWTNSEVLDMTVITGDESLTTRQTCPMVAGSVRVCNENYGTTGWMGLTTYGLDANGHLERAIVQMNDSYSAQWTSFAGLRNHVMCHELGHSVGLAHTSEDGSSQQSCMDYSTDINSQWPSGANYSTLLSIYAHKDSYNSYAGAPSGTSTPVTTSPTAPAPSGSTTPTCAAKGKSGKTACRFEPPKNGRRLKADRFEEVWMTPREGGGSWVYHYYLAP